MKLDYFKTFVDRICTFVSVFKYFFFCVFSPNNIYCHINGYFLESHPMEIFALFKSKFLGTRILNKMLKTNPCNISFSMESFTADFSHFCSTIVKIRLLYGWLSTFSSIPGISGIFLRFRNILLSLKLFGSS